MPTTILNDKEIICHVKAGAMIEPFHAEQVREADGQKVVSYGLSSFGYDVRLAREFKIIRRLTFWQRTKDLFRPRVLSPLRPDDIPWESVEADTFVIPRNSMVLARTEEYIRMPTNGIALCLGKSTYARLGLIVNVTPLEPAWHGHITIEISNTQRKAVEVHAGMGIAQLVFFTGERPSVTYSDRGGKYQGQTGVTLAKL